MVPYSFLLDGFLPFFTSINHSSILAFQWTSGQDREQPISCFSGRNLDRDFESMWTPLSTLMLLICPSACTEKAHALDSEVDVVRIYIADISFPAERFFDEKHIPGYWNPGDLNNHFSENIANEPCRVEQIIQIYTLKQPMWRDQSISAFKTTSSMKHRTITQSCERWPPGLWIWRCSAGAFY